MAVLGTWITSQLVFDGVVFGFVYGLLAMGIVLIYRSTRVINIAVGNMGMLGAGLFALLTVNWGMHYWIAAAVSLALGVVWGAIIELVVVRRLFTAPRVIVLVATIGIAQLCLLVFLSYPDVSEPGAPFPQAVGSTWNDVFGIQMTGAQLAILVVVPIVAVVLGWFLTHTTLGKTVKASADNPDRARLSGINPKLVSTFVWAAGGALSTIALSLITGLSGSANNIDTLGPSTLVRALAAAVIAGMVSFPWAFAAGVGIGVTESVIRFNFIDQAGLIDFILFLAILVAVWFQSRTTGADETRTFTFAPRVRPVPERLRSRWWVRHLDRAGIMLMGAVAIVLPLIVQQPSRHLLYASIVVFAICAMSLTVLTGWAGQLSLSQMAFAGIGAYLAGGFQRGVTVDIGIGDTKLIDAGTQPVSFPVAVVLAMAVTAILAALIGVGALRVRGLVLAVSTFAFALACSQYVYRRPILTGGFSGTVPFERGDLFGIDLSNQRTYYYVCLTVLAVIVVILGRLRRSGVGWSTIGVRDNPDTAAAYTVSPVRTKLRAFALAGALAGLGGALLGGLAQGIPPDRFFQVNDSLLLVSMLVIGGLGATTGPVLGATWVIGLPAFFPESDIVPLLTSSVGLLVLLLYFPGGLVQIGYSTRDALLAWAERRSGPAPAKTQITVPPSLQRTRPPRAPDVPVPLLAERITVRFGGNIAVNDASIEVREHEVVGLIGTNGAGKSTLMNAIGGFVPAKGTVRVLGSDVSHSSATRRARIGLGRSFQTATLFPELTVLETVQVALEARGRSGIVSTALCFPPAIQRARRHRAAAAEIVDFLGLGRFADAYVGELSTGTRRIVELAGLFALEPEVLCLDEPTAGVAQRETEAFGPLILEVRRELGASMLVVEHDMPLIMSISDRVYCLEAGRVIAEGAPSSVRADPAVIASYLGTDERAIARSGERLVVAEP